MANLIDAYKRLLGKSTQPIKNTYEQVLSPSKSQLGRIDVKPSQAETLSRMNLLERAGYGLNKAIGEPVRDIYGKIPTSIVGQGAYSLGKAIGQNAVGLGKEIGDFATRNLRSSNQELVKDLGRTVVPQSARVGLQIGGATNPVGMAGTAFGAGLTGIIESVRNRDIGKGLLETQKQLPQLAELGAINAIDPLSNVGGGFLKRNLIRGVGNVAEDLAAYKLGVIEKPTGQQLAISALTPAGLDVSGKVLGKFLPKGKLNLTDVEKQNVVGSEGNLVAIKTQDGNLMVKDAKTGKIVTNPQVVKEVTDKIKFTIMGNKQPDLEMKREVKKPLFELPKIDERGEAQIGTLFGRGEDPLISEAKKYKSAKEFVNKQKPIFHGTPEKFEKFDVNRSEGGATWFTSDTKDITNNTAGAVQKTGQKLNIMDRYVKPDIKLATPEMADKYYTDELIQQGYRGVKYPKGTASDYEWTKLWFPNEDTITKSQLTDIWNKANRASERGSAQIGTLLGKPQDIKEKGFLKTTKESAKTTPDLSSLVDSKDPYYLVQKNVDEISKAEALIKQDVTRAKALLTSPEDIGVNKSVLGVRLAKFYESNKQFDEALDVIESLDRTAREQGRGIQALSLWNKMAPETIVRSADRVATKLGRELPKDVKTTILGRMGEISKMADGEAKDAATLDVLNYIADKLPPTKGEIFDAYRYTNLLSSPKTHERNISNNLFNTLVTRPADIAFEGLYSVLKDPFNPVVRDVNISDAPRYYKDVFSNLNRAFSAAMQGMKQQPLTADMVGDSAIESLRKQNIPTALQVIPKFMQAQDQFFSTLIASAEKSRLLRNGVSEELASKRARDIAESYLLRDQLGKNKDSGYIVKALDSLGQLALNGRKLPAIGKAWSWFVPFVTTPINAAKMMVERTPAGLVGGKIDPSTLAKATAGSLVMLAGANLASQNKVTWEAPKDAKEKEFFYASGKKPFSVMVGDKWVPAWYLGPYALALLVPAAIKQYNEESPTALTDDQIAKLGRAVSSLSKFVVSQTPLQGVGSFFSLLEGDADYTVSSITGSLGTQVIPLSSLQRWVNTIVDPIYRKGSDFESQLKKSIVGMTSDLKPYTEPTGEVSRRLPINAVLPYDIGQRNVGYEPFEAARISKLQQNALENKARKELESGDKTTAMAGEKKLIRLPDGTIKTISMNVTLEPPKLSGNSELDKKLVSKYNGQVTSRINDVVTLFEQGLIDAKKANDEISKLSKLKKIASGKVKKIKVKKPKMIKIKAPRKIKARKLTTPTLKPIKLKY